MKTLSFAVLALSLLAACGDDTGGGTTSGSGGSGGTSSSGGDGDGDGDGDTSSTTGNPTSSSGGEGGDPSVGTTGPGGLGGGGGGAEFICDDGEPVPAEYECDGIADCDDESDEFPVNPTCPVFVCTDGSEIPDIYACDGELHCPDESDEFPLNPDCDEPVEVPEEWVCDPTYYGTDDGCDCGCGAVDLDCADATADSCEFCEPDVSCADDGSGKGSCDVELLNPADNSQCI